jgi:hypothetical protein
MKLFNLFLISFLVLIFIGCSSSTESTKTDETSFIADSSPKIITSDNINIIIPPGWKEIEDNNEQIFEIWLINKFENAVIAFIPISLSHNLESSSEQSELDIIEQILITKKKNSGVDFELIEERVIGSDYENKSIMYLLDDKYQNSILFGNGIKYYECIAYFHDEYLPSDEEVKDLFATQQEIVSKTFFK